MVSNVIGTDADNKPTLEAHGTGTALGDPIEVRVACAYNTGVIIIFQVGAAARAFLANRGSCSVTFGYEQTLACTSLKANMGHLEAAAAAAGLASLTLGPLFASVVAGNAQLRG